jgi:hypothetical protein
MYSSLLARTGLFIAVHGGFIGAALLLITMGRM